MIKHLARGVLAAGVCLAAAGPAWAEPAGLRAFQTGDGAMVIHVGGDIADPYFGNKSLILAIEAGVNVRAELHAWLAWLLPRQRPDGGFDRFCGARSGQWIACMTADADDSTAATTIHLLRLARDRGWLNARDDQRAQKAERMADALLQSLYDDGRGLYRVFESQAVYYLMDNVEVYEALLSQRRTAEAAKLAQSVRSQFYRSNAWEPAIPLMDREHFYPHALARTYLWESGILKDSESAADMAGWLAHFSDRWLTRHEDPYAWGIVAWNIHRLAPAEAACWRKSVRLPPANAGWTVLDAAADAALAQRGVGISCSRSLGAASATPAAGT